MEKKKWKKASQELVDLFYKVMESYPEVDLKKMFGYPCAFYQGNMFTGLHEQGWVVRLDLEEREQAFVKGLGTKFEPMAGRVMKEYVSLSQEILSDPAKVDVFVEKALAFAKTLPEKKKPVKA